MTSCFCSTIRHLVEDFQERQLEELVPAINSHLADLRCLLTRSKRIARQVDFQVIPRKQRTNKALTVDSDDTASVVQACQQFENDVYGFWSLLSNDQTHNELRRRLACVVVYLRSKLGSNVLVPVEMRHVLQGHQNLSEIRNAGRKYLQIARKLNDLGAIIWLPLNVPPSTYERYLSLEDEEVFSHLRSIGATHGNYTSLVQGLILHQLQGEPQTTSYYNLLPCHPELIPASDRLLLLLYALGGSNIPDVLLTSIHNPQRRWNTEGEIENHNAAELGLSADLVQALSNRTDLAETLANPHVTKHVLDGNIVAWSLSSEFMSGVSLTPPTLSKIRDEALDLLCFVCPPCYEGNNEWSPAMKSALWPIFDHTITACPKQALDRMQVIEACLFFCEKDSVAIRHAALKHAKKLLQKSMPYYFHASIVLFQSILERINGDFAASETHIRNLQWRGPRPQTRRDHALQGRIHISKIETKIKCYDRDVPEMLYEWAPQKPLSSLDTEVMLRLQRTAARFFQSVGDFESAKASLEQYLSLDMTTPMRANTRRTLVSRLADTYCETEEYSRAAKLLETELGRANEDASSRRIFRKLLAASVDVNIGLSRLDAAASTLQDLSRMERPPLDDVYDQQLYMRILLAQARLANAEGNHNEELLRWKLALREVEGMPSLGSSSGFTAALIHLSLAHAQLLTNNEDDAKRSWAAGLAILRIKPCEYWIPVVPTIWLRQVTAMVQRSQGWLFSMMLPGDRQ